MRLRRLKRNWKPKTRRTGRRRISQISILRPLAAAVAFIGIAVLVILGYRSFGGRRKAEQKTDIPQAQPQPSRQSSPRPSPQSSPPQSPLQQTPESRRRSRRALRFGIRHPLSIALVVVILVVLSTAVYLQFVDRLTTIDGIEHQPSEYDQFFTYPQMEAITHFAKCDAMLFSTTPEEELENVKERMAIEVEFDSASAGSGSQADKYTRRVRSPEEIAEAIRLGSEFYDRVNCL